MLSQLHIAMLPTSLHSLTYGSSHSLPQYPHNLLSLSPTSVVQVKAFERRKDKRSHRHFNPIFRSDITSPVWYVLLVKSHPGWRSWCKVMSQDARQVGATCKLASYWQVLWHLCLAPLSSRWDHRAFLTEARRKW